MIDCVNGKQWDGLMKGKRKDVRGRQHRKLNPFISHLVLSVEVLVLPKWQLLTIFMKTRGGIAKKILVVELAWDSALCRQNFGLGQITQNVALYKQAVLN